ncbi:metal ABC transporter ATP-binding protein [Streptomyces noursei]|uniref:metal ABC transporter ATP-binding protein n=1 Tax=Streptomyces noursei TaxID=1971 RepID=UPI001675B485|nr:ATP-binding cassette domain-containing protein [Streptomyces noursei]MCZ1012733.1 ATP-binding cassette domain-containing protein [Streptomyces noursei]GGX42434.1 ABC transporter ATP-binding protein [Streptomyces noursei]
MNPIAKGREAVAHNGHSHHAVPAPRPHDTAAEPGSGPVVALRDAAVRVGGRTLWEGVDLRIGPGEFTAVLGPNGVGKSTMIKVLLGTLPAAGGEVRVLGARPGQANDRIGYLPQRRSFDASMRIRGIDVVRMGLDGDRWGVPLPFPTARRRAERERVAEVVELVGASGYAHRPIGQCSGGEQQRLLIAQALVRRPELLLLDEPLDSLDLPNQSAVAALIGRICHQAGVAVVMVAHDVNPILHHLDRVVYLAEGGAAAGTPQEVVTSQTLTRLYGTPVEVLRTSDGRLVVVGQPEAPAVHADRHDATGGGHAAG